MKQRLVSVNNIRFRIIKFPMDVFKFEFFFKQKQIIQSANLQEFNQIPILLQEDSENTHHEYTLDEAVHATSE